jgi:preprotein translocase subunit SecE
MAEKIGLFAKTKIFLGEVRTEMTKVVWPTREQTKVYTVVVIASTAVVGLVIGVWDLILSRVVQFIFRINT